MAKLPNRLVIEITNTDKVDELGNPVIGFESKDYAECIIEELENIKAEIEEVKSRIQKEAEEYYNEVGEDRYTDGLYASIVIIDDMLSELKGEKNEEKTKM